jgi:hypothetical protein
MVASGRRPTNRQIQHRVSENTEPGSGMNLCVLMTSALEPAFSANEYDAKAFRNSAFGFPSDFGFRVSDFKS